MSDETLQRLYHKDIASRYPRGSKERESAEGAAASHGPPSSPGKNGGAPAPLPSSPRAAPREDPEATFHPKIEKKSAVLALKRYGGSIPVEARLFKEADKIAARKEVRKRSRMLLLLLLFAPLPTCLHTRSLTFSSPLPPHVCRSSPRPSRRWR
jgi:hypothetical protein